MRPADETEASEAGEDARGADHGGRLRGARAPEKDHRDDRGVVQRHRRDRSKHEATHGARVPGQVSRRADQADAQKDGDRQAEAEGGRIE